MWIWERQDGPGDKYTKKICWLSITEYGYKKLD